MAASFSLSQAATLDYAQVALFAAGPNDPQVNVSVYSDINGKPGAPLYDLGSITVEPYDKQNPQGASVYQATGTGSPPRHALTLSPGFLYWLVLQNPNPTDPTEAICWAKTTRSGSLGYATYENETGWVLQGPDYNPVTGVVPTSPAFEIYATVPEPSTYLAGALVLLPFGVSALRSLRKRQVA